MAGREEIYQQAMKRGHSAAWEGNWTQAAGFYRQAVEEFPDRPAALTSLGLAFFESQDYEDALRCYVQASKLSPDDPLCIEKIAQIYARLRKIDLAQSAAMRAAELHLKNRDVNKAIDNWKMATQLNPANLQAHTRLALVYERMGQKEMAVNELLIIASLFQHSQQVDKAYQAIQYALRLLPSSTQALDALTMLKENKPLPRPSPSVVGIQTETGLHAPTLQAGEQGETPLDPISEAHQKALSALAGMLFEGPEIQSQTEQRRKGLQDIVQGAEVTPVKQVDATRMMFYLSQVVDLQSRGELGQAARELERAMEVGLNHPAAYFNLGWLYFKNGRIESALRMLQHAVQHPDFALATRLLAGHILSQMGKVKEASSQYMKALSLADASLLPESQAREMEQMYEPLIEAQGQISDPEHHKKLCENISGFLNRADWRVQLSKARQQLAAQGDGGGLIPVAEIITQARSSQVVEALGRIHELSQAGHLRSAMEEAYHALQYAPTYLPLHVQMGELLLKQNQLQEAVDKFEMVAKAYQTRGEALRAAEILRRITEIAPLELEPRQQRIAILQAIGQAEEALREQINLAETCYSQADLDQTRKAYVEALRLVQQYNLEHSWRIKILYRLADLYQQSLEWRQALHAYEQICTLEPDEDKARLAMLDLLFRLGEASKAISEANNYTSQIASKGQIERAITFLENLCDDSIARLPLRLRLAGYYRQMGRVEEAVLQLDAAGETLLQRGDKEGTRKIIAQILAMKPANAEKYQQLLEQLG